ncbi:MAG: hypothetical protein KAH14_09395 [Clostridiales bacterium]|nr:hypothetical protein [Clostridiales bacterium]
MKEKLLNYLLLESDVYKRPLRKRSTLLLLCVGAGLVTVLNYSIQNGFGFIKDVYSIIMTVVLVFFCGIFSMVVYSWPTADLAANVGKASGKLNIFVKRMKVAKGFLFAVIYTGIVATLLRMLFNSIMELNEANFASGILSVVISIWAGAIVTRCIITVFEEAIKKKMIVFLLASAWYYIIMMQIMGFIIKGAYSIIL